MAKSVSFYTKGSRFWGYLGGFGDTSWTRLISSPIKFEDTGEGIGQSQLSDLLQVFFNHTATVYLIPETTKMTVFEHYKGELQPDGLHVPITFLLRYIVSI